MGGQYKNFLYKRSNPDARSRNRKKNRVRRKLRVLGYLPKYGDKLNKKQQKIWDDINNDNYTFWEKIRKNKGPEGYKNKKHKQYKVISPEEMILMRARQNAKDRGYDFNLELCDIIIPKKCPYLKIILLTNFEDRFSSDYYTIDRVDSSKGYVKGNIQIISKKANLMKNNATKEELLTFAKNVLKLNKN